TLRGGVGTSLAFSPDNKYIAVGCAVVSVGIHSFATIWDAATGKEILSLPVHQVRSIAYSPDGKRLATGLQGFGKSTNVVVWDVQTGRNLLTVEGLAGINDVGMDGVGQVAYAPDGKQIVNGADDGTIKLWDATTGHKIFTYKGHATQVNGVVFSPDGKQIA